MPPQFELVFSVEAERQLSSVEKAQPKKAKKVKKALALLEQNPRHPGLQTHKYGSLAGPRGEEVFEAYVENQTPSAWRIFWCYSDAAPLTAGKTPLLVISITPHP